MPCVAGTFLPEKSTGACTEHRCPPGTADADSSATTACTACVLGVSYALNAGAVVCAPVLPCGPGYEEAAVPTVFTNRVCVPCTLGLTYKEAAGQATRCVPTSTCIENKEFEAASPSLSADRLCLQKTAVLTTCTAAEYERHAPTRTSDRQCAVATLCGARQYELVKLTPSADRACVDVYVTLLYFDAIYDVLLFTESATRTFREALTTSLVGLGIAPTNITDIVFFRGSVGARVLVRTTAAMNAINAGVVAGRVQAQSLVAMACPVDAYIDTAATATAPQHCSARARCTSGVQYQSHAGTLTTDRQCKLGLSPGPSRTAWRAVE